MGGSFSVGVSAGVWADNLVFGGFWDWQLPDIGKLFGLAQEVGDLTQVSHFTNVGPTPGFSKNLYWSSTESPHKCTGTILFGKCVSGVTWNADHWALEPVSGEQKLVYDSFFIPIRMPAFAVAVHAGDVAAAIPEPQTYALMLMGVGAVLLARRKRTR